LFSQILISQRKLAFDLIECCFRDVNSARFGYTLQPGCHVNSIAVDDVILLNHISQINADSKSHPTVLRQLKVTVRQFFLNRYGALNRIDHTGKLCKH